MMVFVEDDGSMLNLSFFFVLYTKTKVPQNNYEGVVWGRGVAFLSKKTTNYCLTEFLTSINV